MQHQHTAGPVELNQNNIIRPLSHTPTTSSSDSSRSDSTFEAPSKSSHRLSLNVSKRVFRPRSKSPSPINTELPVNRTRRSASEVYNKTTPRILPTRTSQTSSPTAMSPTESTSQPSTGHRREHSYSSQNRRNSDDFRRYNGTVNHYGRHANDWLFGGFSIRDTVREGVDRLRHGKES